STWSLRSKAGTGDIARPRLYLCASRKLEPSRMQPISLEDLVASEGGEVGVSPWRAVTQTMIDQFADATDDHQFIHCDPERAARETPYGGTIAHGFLLLSLLSAMTYETMPPIEGGKMGVNHGFDEIRFKAPVKTGSRIRARFVLAGV